MLPSSESDASSRPARRAEGRRTLRRALGASALALAVGYGAASCGSDPLPFTTGSTTGGGGDAATSTTASSGTAGGGGEGGTLGPGCDACGGDTPVCVDGDHCAAACPSGRDACGAGAPGEPASCCGDGEQCCEASVFGYAGADLCKPSGEACPVGCPGGDEACGIHQFCQADPVTEGYACKDDCALSQLCDANLCCPLGAECVELGSCPLPDLTIDAAQLAASIIVETKYFAADACEIIEGCVTAPGVRMLMRFDLKTPNIGEGDLVMGDPTGNPLFHYSDCHEHFHFDGYADYRLLNAQDIEVGQGHKQAFCLLDFEQVDPTAPQQARFDCGYQGIQSGWADTYGSYLPCQWVDVTDVAPGDYQLKVTLNKDRTIAEENYENDVVIVPVTVPTDTCPNGCREDDAACCQAGDPCGWGQDGSCDCADFFGWDGADCGGCLDSSAKCDLSNTCPAGCTLDQGACCAAGDPCGLADDGACNCQGVHSWDGNDCSHCTTANAICPVNSCPNGCSPPNPNDACCGSAAACGWNDDGWCDCGGAAWDVADCASCLSLDPDCP